MGKIYDNDELAEVESRLHRIADTRLRREGTPEWARDDLFRPKGTSYAQYSKHLPSRVGISGMTALILLTVLFASFLVLRMTLMS